MQLVLVDAYDSFTHNLVHGLAATGARVSVVRCDEIEAHALLAADAVVLGPGPGSPREAGCFLDAVRQLVGVVPLLGVCLGHQAIAVAFGAEVARGTPCHGKPWPIRHGGDALFEGVPSPFRACRYHSLTVVPASLPAELRADAWTPEGEVMAFRHVERPVFGVQFHPESFCTEHGERLLSNFLARCA